MAASTEKTNAQKYVISRIDYDGEMGYYPTSLICARRYNSVSAIRFEGSLEETVKLAESNLPRADDDLGVFWWDHENDHWSLEVILHKQS